MVNYNPLSLNVLTIPKIAFRGSLYIMRSADFFILKKKGNKQNAAGYKYLLMAST